MANRQEVKMSPKKVFWVELLVLMLTLSLISPAFSQGGPDRRIANAGVIVWVSWDLKYIAINTSEHKILITPQTKVLDEQGNSLRVSDLRRGLRIVIEVVRISDGSMEKRIIIKK
jgi:hypothetical protein